MRASAMRRISRPGTLCILGFVIAVSAACGVAGAVGNIVGNKTPKLTSISVYLLPNSAPAGATVRATWQGYDQGGGTISTGATTWSTSSSAIAAIAATNDTAVDVTTIIPGTVQIICSAGGVTGQATLTVVVNPVATITLTPANPTVRLGERIVLTPTPIGADGNPVSGLPCCSKWTTSDPSKVSVNQFGAVRGEAVGSATITVSIVGRTASTLVTVIP